MQRRGGANNEDSNIKIYWKTICTIAISLWTPNIKWYKTKVIYLDLPLRYKNDAPKFGLTSRAHSIAFNDKDMWMHVHEQREKEVDMHACLKQGWLLEHVEWRCRHYPFVVVLIPADLRTHIDNLYQDLYVNSHSLGGCLGRLCTKMCLFYSMSVCIFKGILCPLLLTRRWTLLQFLHMFYVSHRVLEWIVQTPLMTMKQVKSSSTRWPTMRGEWHVELRTLIYNVPLVSNIVGHEAWSTKMEKGWNTFGQEEGKGNMRVQWVLQRALHEWHEAERSCEHNNPLARYASLGTPFIAFPTQVGWPPSS